VRATGVDTSRVNSLLEWCDAGRAMPSADHLFGQTLKGDESVCNLFGYCLEWTRTADAVRLALSCAFILVMTRRWLTRACVTIRSWRGSRSSR
jgi:hypothetical protein